MTAERSSHIICPICGHWTPKYFAQSHVTTCLDGLEKNEEQSAKNRDSIKRSGNFAEPAQKRRKIDSKLKRKRSQKDCVVIYTRIVRCANREEVILSCQANEELTLNALPKSGSSSMESVSIEANGQQIGFIHGLVARFLHPLIEDSTYDVKVSFLKEKQTHRCNYIEVQISGKDTANSSFQEATEFSKTKGSLEELLNYEDRHVLFFNEALATVLKQDRHLFFPNELKWLSEFESLPRESQRLILRIFFRQRKWLLPERFQYEEISNPLKAVQSLVEAGYLKDTQSCTEITFDMLEGMPKKQLKLFFKEMRLKMPNISGGEFARHVLQQLNKQKTLFGESLTKSKRTLSIFKKVVGTWVMMDDSARDAFARCQFLFFLNLEQRFNMKELGDLNIRRFPKYEISHAPIFFNRDTITRYLNALNAYNEASDDVGNQVVENASFHAQRGEEGIAVSLSDKADNFQLIYRPLYIWGKVLHQACKLYEKGKVKDYDRLLVLYETLIYSQKASHRKGHWYVRAALIADTHLKQHRKSFELCVQGIKDPSAMDEYKLALQKRLTKLRKKLKRKIELEYPVVEKEFWSKITIEGADLKHKLSVKCVFFDDDNQAIRVEQYVLNYFAQQNFKGVHCENSIYSTLFALFMHKVVFHPIPGVFQNPYQSAPLDLGTKWFYENRKQLVHDRISEIQSMSREQIRESVEDFYEKHRGEAIRGIGQKYGASDLGEMACCLGGKAIAAICLRLAKDYHWLGGLPDLFLYQPHPTKPKVKIVEVKSVNDKLSEKQRCWLNYFCASFASEDIEICVCSVKKE